MNALQGYVQDGLLREASIRVASSREVLFDTSVGGDLQPLYRMYSQSKVVTAVALLICFERGLVGIDDLLGNYLPEWLAPKVLVKDAQDPAEVQTTPTRPITLRHLLTHTSGVDYSGLAPYDPLPAGVGVVADKFKKLGERVEAGEIQTMREWSEELASIPMKGQPGESWDYGFSIDLIGIIVEVVSGKTLPDFLQKEIFRPLGMKDTGFHVTEENRYRLGPFYRATEKDPETDKRDLFIVDGSGDSQNSCGYTQLNHSPLYSGGGGVNRIKGGLVSTMDDWTRFALMLLGKGTLAGAGSRDPVTILRAETMAMATEDHLPLATQHAEAGPCRGIFPSPDQISGSRCVGPSFCLLGSLDVGNDASGSGSERGGNDKLRRSRGSYGWGGMGGTTFFVDPTKEVVYLLMTNRWADPTMSKIWDQLENEAYSSILGEKKGAKL